MTEYFFKRLLFFLPTVFGVVTLVFFLIHMIPGDPIDLMLGDSALPAQRSELREKLHLNEPILTQYGRFLKEVVTFKLGESIQTGEAVSLRIQKRFPPTFFLASTSLFFALLLSIPFGLFAAYKQGTWIDTSLMSISLFGLSVPAFWFGPMLALFFSFYLGWFPISGMEEFSSVVLPALTLGSGMAALTTRTTRAAVIDILQQDYIRFAWAKGLSPSRVLFTHALRSTLLPILTIVGLQAGSLLSGSVITEKVFSWPGIGTLLIEAIEKRDFPVVQGVVLVISLIYLLLNLVTDLLYAWADPRVRLR